MESWQLIVLLGAVAAVCASLLPRKSSRKEESRTVRNMETALEQFMENMEADNREIASLVASAQKESEQLAQKRDARIGELEKRCAELEHALAEQARLVLSQVTRGGAPQSPYLSAYAERPRNVQPAAPSASAMAAAAREEAVIMPEPEEPAVKQESIRSRYAELFELHDGGKSVDAIARKLGMNKGEVQLILQFSKQEEAGRHE